MANGLLCRERDHAVTGLIMPRVLRAREAHNLYSPKQRQREYPNADWLFLLWVARNAAAAVDVVHRAGHVIGDVNQKGVLVRQDATVQLIDCDSFQIVNSGRRFLCQVGVPEFTPPELHGKPFASTLRSPNHDSFGLAVLIFHLLFMGRHPFAGRYSGHGEMPIDRAIREMRFAYSQTAAARQMVPPPHSLSLSDASFPVASLFERAFGSVGANGSRPSARDWVDTLDTLKAELRRCGTDGAHTFHKALPRCPWCEIERGGGPSFFVTVSVAGVTTAPFDFAATWAPVEQLRPFASLPRALPIPTVPAAAATPVPTRIRLSKFFPMFYFLAGVAAVFTFGLFLGSSGGLLAGAIVAVAYALSGEPAWKKERDTRKSVLALAEAQLTQLTDSWLRENAAARNAYMARRNAAEALVREYKDLPERQKREREALKAKQHQLQKHSFLDNHYLRDASLPGIGSALKATLISEGFETAADINPGVIRVQGIGPQRYTVLLSWRSAIEQRFRFDPAIGIKAADLAAVDRAVALRQRELQRQLTQAKVEILGLYRRAEHVAALPLLKLSAAARQIAQAQANLHAL